MKMNAHSIQRLRDLCIDSHFDLQQWVAAEVPDSDRTRMYVVRHRHNPLHFTSPHITARLTEYIADLQKYVRCSLHPS